jgi:hypothetical protein
VRGFDDSLTAHIAQMRQLTRIALKGISPYRSSAEDGFVDLAPLTSLPVLTQLKLEGLCVCTSGFLAFKSLKMLHWSTQRQDVKRFQAWAVALRGAARLMSRAPLSGLQLQLNDLKLVGMPARLLVENNSLQVMNLFGEFSGSSRDVLTNLGMLELKNVELTEPDLSELGCIKQLTGLSLEGNKVIGSSAIGIIASFWESTLVYLNLSSCSLVSFDWVFWLGVFSPVYM